MFPAWILLMFNNLFFTLRLSGGVTGSFPRPLKAEEERRYLELAAQGDLEARNKLIEHNLRLVAHIIKKGYCKGQIGWYPGLVRPEAGQGQEIKTSRQQRTGPPWRTAVEALCTCFCTDWKYQQIYKK